MNLFESFLLDLDGRWGVVEKPKVALKVLGSTALFLQTDYVRGTRDGDVFRTPQLDERVTGRLLELGGQNSELHRAHGLYVDIVSPNIPLLPYDALWHHHELELESFAIEVLDVADVVVSKFKRWVGRDRDDVRAMIEGGHVARSRLVERFEAVVQRYRFDARATELPGMASRINQAEEDWFVVAPTRFELPDDAFR